MLRYVLRDYLFRGKTPDGKWHFGDGIYYSPHGVLITNQAETVMVESKTVGIAIKHKDAYEKEIYTGDIVLVDADEQGTVMYSETDAMYEITCDNLLYGFNDLCDTEIEIIGNIHDNPDFL